MKMQTIETEYFYKIANLWFCKHCSTQSDDDTSSFEKNDLSAFEKTALTAKWLDESHNILYCPSCGVQEEINKA